MERWRVAGPEHRDGGARRQDQGAARPCPGAGSAIARWAPGKQAIAKDQKRGRWIFRQQDEGAVGQSTQRCFKPDLATGARLDAGHVERPVDGGGRRIRSSIEGPPPRRLEHPKILAPARAARAVAGGESGRLVEKEQRAAPSRPLLSCRIPRLPIRVPRAVSATISLVGVTRFCSGIGGPYAARGPYPRSVGEPAVVTCRC
jgi:hypothetical protein